MLLHDTLDEAVADVHADLPTLVTAARAQGLSIRRRRRMMATVGTAAVLALVATVGYALVPGPDTDDDTTVASDRFDVGELSGRTAPITPPGAVVALGAAVGQVADGDYQQLRGYASDGATLVELLFRPSGGSGPAGQVDLSLMPLRGHAARLYACDESYMQQCTTTPMANGDTLRTYTDEDPGSTPTYERRVAEVLSPERGLRLVLGAANTSAAEWRTVRPEPVLTTSELAAIATLPWWGRTRLPEEYVAEGRDLTQYASLG
jgi:hypothetical protein